jgi:hypothetical protein
MYKNYSNIENLNHELVIIFQEDGKMASLIPSVWQDGFENLVAPS